MYEKALNYNVWSRYSRYKPFRIVCQFPISGLSGKISWIVYSRALNVHREQRKDFFQQTKLFFVKSSVNPKKRNFATNFLTHISLQPDGVDLCYFKLKLFDQTELIVWNISCLRLWVAKILGLEHKSLWQRLNPLMNLSDCENLYINLALSVCLYSINVKKAEPIIPKFFVGFRVTPVKVYELSKLKKICVKFFFIFVLKWLKFTQGLIEDGREAP